MTTEIRAMFPNMHAAQKARQHMADQGVRAGDMALEVAAPRLVEESAREGQAMRRIVVIIVLASVAGTAIGATLGVILHVTVGPKGTSGLVIQVVSWAIFAHLLIGMWAGYMLLADRTEREIGRARPVILTLRCANIDANTISARLRELDAVEVERHGSAPTSQ